MTELFLEDILANPNARVIIAFPAGDNPVDPVPFTVTAFMRSSLQINVNSNFNAGDSGSAQNALNSAINATVGVINSFSSKNAAQFQLKHLGQTILSWTGATKPVFNFPLTIVATREDQDIRDEVYKLYRAVLPTSRSAGVDQRIIAPLGYGPRTLQATAQGTVSLQVGTWFRARGLVVRSVNFAYSTETLRSGLPMMAEGNVELEPFRMITIDDLRGYFI